MLQAPSPKPRLAFTMLAVLAFASAVAAQATNWTGAVSTQWNLAANWSNGVPTSTSVATIVPAPRVPNAGSGSPLATCRDLVVQVGAGLDGVVGVAVSAVIDAPTNADLHFATLGSSPAWLDCGPGGSIRSLQSSTWLNIGDLHTQSCFVYFSGSLGPPTTLLGAMTVDSLSLGDYGRFNSSTTASMTLGSFSQARYTIFQAPPVFTITGGVTSTTSTSTFTPSAGVTTLRAPNGTVTITNIRIGTAVASAGTTVRFTSFPTQSYSGPGLEDRSSGATSFTSDDPVILERACFFDSLSVRDCTVVPGVVLIGTGGYAGGYPGASWLLSPRIANLEVRGTLTLPPDNGSVPAKVTVTDRAVIRGSVVVGAYGYLDFQPMSSSTNPEFRVESGGMLALSGYATMTARGPMRIFGTATVGAGARIAVAAPSGAIASALVVEAGGVLELVGGPFSPPFLDPVRNVQRTMGHHLAAVGGAPGNPWQFAVDGTIRGRGYRIGDLGPQGLQLRPGSSIGAAPLDMGEGVLGPAHGPLATILSVDTGNPVVLRDVVFDNWAQTATYNVAASSASHVRLLQPGGNFAGPQHEYDPANVVHWDPEWGTRASARAHSLPGTGQIEMVTEREIDVARFEVYSAQLGSPAVWAPQGDERSSASYSLALTGTAPFEIVELSHRGVYRTIGGGNGRPASPTSPGTSVSVDPSSPNGFTTLAAAVAAVPTGGTILVAPGTHAVTQLTIGRAMTIVGRDASGFRVTGDITITAGSGNAPVTIRGMTLAGTAAPSRLRIVDTARAVILDRVTFDNGPSSSGFDCTRSNRVVLQAVRSSTASAIGASTMFLSRCGLGVVNLDQSRVEAVETTTTAVTTTNNSTWHGLTGVMPTLATHAFWSSGDALAIFCHAAPGHLVFVGFAFRDFFEFQQPSIDMPLLLQLSNVINLGVGQANVSGGFVASVAAPNAPSLAGLCLPMQLVTWDSTGAGRCGWTTDVMLLP